MKRLISLSCLLMFLVSCVSCSTDDDDVISTMSASNSSSSSSSSSTTTKVNADTVSVGTTALIELGTDQTTFDVSLSDADYSLVTTSETIITDESNDFYDDYIENASFSTQITITYNGTTATVDGSVDGLTVSTSGAYVTATSETAGIEYILKGTTTSGNFKLYSSKKSKLTLSDVDITSTTGAAINIQSSKTTYVVVEDGTSNTLTDASSYTATPDDEDEKACLFSEGQLVFSGSGTLTVTGNYKHAICSDDYVRVRSGVNIIVDSAVKDGLHTNDAVYVDGGLLDITSSSDGIDTDGTIDITGGVVLVSTSGSGSKGIKAEGNITISGGQQIVLTSGAAYYDSSESDEASASALKGGGNIVISGGEFKCQSTGSGGKGIRAGGTLNISGGDVRVITTGKYYKYSSSMTASPKGIKSTGVLTISGGDVRVRATGGENSEGIESKSTITITGGNVASYAYDDAINASTSIIIAGGTVYAYGTNNDGIDSNGTLYIKGGVIVSSGTTTPEEGIDCDQNTFSITGGIVLGIGGSTSTPTTSASTQRSVILTGSYSSGTRLTFTDSSGNVVMSYSVPRAYSQGTVLFSSPDLASSSTYTVYTGGTLTDATTFCGLSVDGTYTAGTKSTTFTTSSMVTSVGSSSSSSSMMGGGMGGGGMFR